MRKSETDHRTTMVKTIVQNHAHGLLNGPTGLAKIKVNYIQPPAAGSTDDSVDVSGQSNANNPPPT